MAQTDSVATEQIESRSIVLSRLPWATGDVSAEPMPVTWVPNVATFVEANGGLQRGDRVSEGEDIIHVSKLSAQQQQDISEQCMKITARLVDAYRDFEDGQGAMITSTSVAEKSAQVNVTASSGLLSVIPFVSARATSSGASKSLKSRTYQFDPRRDYHTELDALAGEAISADKRVRCSHQLDAALIAHAGATVRSPVTGVIDSILKPNDEVGPRTTLVTVRPDDWVEVIVNVGPWSYQQIRSHSPCWVRWHYDWSRPVAGYVKRRGVGRDEHWVSCKPLTPPPEYFEDMHADVELQFTKENVLSVPSEAIQKDGDQDGVCVLQDNGRARLAPVLTGAAGEHRIEIVEGVLPGDVVVLNPLQSEGCRSPSLYLPPPVATSDTHREEEDTMQDNIRAPTRFALALAATGILATEASGAKMDPMEAAADDRTAMERIALSWPVHAWLDDFGRPIEVPLSEWPGVYMQNGRVVGIDLSDRGLRGPIPAEIGWLDSLTFLDVTSTFLDATSNNLSGAVPVSIGRLRLLDRLLLAGNARLRGAFPVEAALITPSVIDVSGTGLCLPEDGGLDTWASKIGRTEGLLACGESDTTSTMTTVARMEVAAGLFDEYHVVDQLNELAGILPGVEVHVEAHTLSPGHHRPKTIRVRVTVPTVLVGAEQGLGSMGVPSPELGTFRVMGVVVAPALVPFLTDGGYWDFGADVHAVNDDGSVLVSRMTEQGHFIDFSCLHIKCVRRIF